MNKLKYRAILWDNDGTIADTEAAIVGSFKHAMKEVLGVDNPDIQKYRKLIGLTLWDQFSHYTEDKDTIDKMFRSYREHNEKTIDDIVSNFKGLPAVLRQLKNKGYFMGIVTSKRHDMTIRGLNILDLNDGIFDYLQGCDDYDAAHKPDPNVLLHAFAKLSLKPNEVLYVGDSIHDIKCASGAGCDSAAVLWGAGTKEDLLEQNPTYVCAKPDDLLTFL